MARLTGVAAVEEGGEGGAVEDVGAAGDEGVAGGFGLGDEGPACGAGRAEYGDAHVGSSPTS